MMKFLMSLVLGCFVLGTATSALPPKSDATTVLEDCGCGKGKPK